MATEEDSNLPDYKVSRFDEGEVVCFEYTPSNKANEVRKCTILDVPEYLQDPKCRTWHDPPGTRPFPKEARMPSHMLVKITQKEAERDRAVIPKEELQSAVPKEERIRLKETVQEEESGEGGGEQKDLDPDSEDVDPEDVDPEGLDPEDVFNYYEMVYWNSPDGGMELVELTDLSPETDEGQRQVTIHRAHDSEHYSLGSTVEKIERTVPFREVEKIDVSDVDTEELGISEGDRVVWENSNGNQKDGEVRKLPYGLQDLSEPHWRDIEPGRTYAQIELFPDDYRLGNRKCVLASKLRKQEAREQEVPGEFGEPFDPEEVDPEEFFPEEEVDEEVESESIQKQVQGQAQEEAQKAADEEESEEVKEKLDKQLTVRVSAREKREIERKAAAAGTSVSRFVAESALSDEQAGVTEEELEEFRRIADKVGDLYQELRQVGGNVSQIAQRIRSRERITSEAIKRAAEAVEQASDDVYDVMNEIPQ